MALRNIRKDGDEVLRKKSKPVSEITEKIKILIEDMFETMYNSEGVGLAAPQIGILKQVIVIDPGNEPLALINPQIIEQRGEHIGLEGCLSIPGKSGEVKRPEYVKVKALDINGKPVIVEAKELKAVILCHEIDHLKGVLFTDKVIRYVED